MKSLVFLAIMLFAQTAVAKTCFLLSSSPLDWEDASERLCLEEISMLVHPEQPESPSNPRIAKTLIKLFAAYPLERHLVASYILDMQPSAPGSTTFGVSVPSNSIFRDITITFEGMHESDERHLRGRVRIGPSVYYYRTIAKS